MTLHPLVRAAFAPAVVHHAPRGWVKLQAMRESDPEKFKRAQSLARENVYDVFEAWDILSAQELKALADDSET